MSNTWAVWLARPRSPTPPHNIENYLYNAVVCYGAATTTQMSCYDAWQEALRKRTLPSDELEYVCKRGKLFVPVTSAIEQPFSQVVKKTCAQRSWASGPGESRSIRLTLVVKGV